MVAKKCKLLLLTIGHIQVFDSVYENINADTIKQICSIVQSKTRSVTIEIMNVIKQRGSTDCGLFALAFATSLCFGESPSERKYHQKDLRTHLWNIFEHNPSTLQQFPSSDWQKIPTNLIKKTMDVLVFCYCRFPEEGNMIECCRCSEWYHETCEVIDQEVWEKEDIDWVCKKCCSRQCIKKRK